MADDDPEIEPVEVPLLVAVDLETTDAPGRIIDISFPPGLEAALAGPKVPYTDDGMPMVRRAFEGAVAARRVGDIPAEAFRAGYEIDAEVAAASTMQIMFGPPHNAADWQQLMGRLERDNAVPDAERCETRPPGHSRCSRARGHAEACAHRAMVSYPIDPGPDPDALLRSYAEWAPPIAGVDLDILAQTTYGMVRTDGETDQGLRRRMITSMRQYGKQANFGIPGGMGAARLQRLWDDYLPSERTEKCNYHDWAKHSATSRAGKIRLRGMRLGRQQLGELAATYALARRDGVPSRHASTRWLRSVAGHFAVADDALLEGDRPRAAQVLSEVVSLQDAVRLTAESFRGLVSRRPRRLSDYVNVKITVDNAPSVARAGFGTQLMVYAADDAANTIAVGDAVSVASDGSVRKVGSGDALSQVIGVAVTSAAPGGLVGIRISYDEP